MSDSDVEDFQRDSQSQFVAQDDDDELLWEVVEITAEKGKRYKVRWAGIDPSTKKPWAQSWVLKSDCTDDLVHEWKRKKAQKKKNGAKGARISAVSRVAGATRVSADSSYTPSKLSTRAESATTGPPSITPNQRKRSRSTVSKGEEQEEAVPKKKRKLNVEKRSRGGKRKKKPAPDDEDEVIFFMPEVEENRRASNLEKAVKMEEEEDSESNGEERERSAPAAPPAESQALPQRSPSLHEQTPVPQPGYMKFKSGKLSTPISKKKRRRSSESASDPTSSSDEAEMVVPNPRLQSPSIPTPPVLSPAASPVPQDAHNSPSPQLGSPQNEAHDDEEHIVREMYDKYVNSNAPQSRPSNGGRASIHSNGAKEDSYRQGVVPETETESLNNTQSQSQSQSQAQVAQQRQPPLAPQPVSSQEEERPRRPSDTPTKTRAPPPKPSRASTEIIQPPATPARSSLVSKMKLRTPGSRSHISLVDDISFHHPSLEAHLEVNEEQLEEAETTEQNVPSRSSTIKSGKANPGRLRPIPRLSPSEFTPHLPSVASTSNSRPEDARTATNAEDSDAAEVEELVSSIEQFSSPEKGRSKRGTAAQKARWKGKGKAKEVIEENSGEERPATDDEGDVAERLEEVVQLRGQQLAARAREERVKRQREYDGELPNGKRRTLNELVSGKNGRRRRDLDDNATEKLKKTKESSSIWWEKEKKSRNRSSRLQSHLQDEEDATQETMDVDDIERNWDDLRQEEEESTQDILMEAAELRPMDEVEIGQAWEVEPPADVPAEPAEPDLEPQGSSPEHEPVRRSRSRSSKSSGKSGRSAQRMASKENIVLPPTAPIPSPPAIESQEPDHNPDFVATLALLNEKSQENIQLNKEITSLREALAAAAQAPRSHEAELELELQLARESLEVAKQSLAEGEKRVEQLIRGKESAEKDREFFREHYAKASGFVTSVREENTQLQELAEVAKEQAKSGVEMVKATFMARIKALEDDVRTYKRLALFIMEKDVRTNDEIRRRAGEEPELRARCAELAKDNRVLKTQLADLRDDFDDKEKEIEELVLKLSSSRKQVAVLNADLCKVKSVVEGEDLVYLCGWRVDDDGNEPCGQVFSTHEELEAHVMSADQHLPQRSLE